MEQDTQDRLKLNLQCEIEEIRPKKRIQAIEPLRSGNFRFDFFEVKKANIRKHCYTDLVLSFEDEVSFKEINHLTKKLWESRKRLRRVELNLKRQSFWIIRHLKACKHVSTIILKKGKDISTPSFVRYALSQLKGVVTFSIENSTVTTEVCREFRKMRSLTNLKLNAIRTNLEEWNKHLRSLYQCFYYLPSPLLISYSFDLLSFRKELFGDLADTASEKFKCSTQNIETYQKRFRFFLTGPLHLEDRNIEYNNFISSLFKMSYRIWLYVDSMWPLIDLLASTTSVLLKLEITFLMHESSKEEPINFNQLAITNLREFICRDIPARHDVYEFILYIIKSNHALRSTKLCFDKMIVQKLNNRDAFKQYVKTKALTSSLDSHRYCVARDKGGRNSADFDKSIENVVARLASEYKFDLPVYDHDTKSYVLLHQLGVSHSLLRDFGFIYGANNLLRDFVLLQRLGRDLTKIVHAMRSHYILKDIKIGGCAYFFDEILTYLSKPIVHLKFLEFTKISFDFSPSRSEISAFPTVAFFKTICFIGHHLLELHISGAKASSSLWKNILLEIPNLRKLTLQVPPKMIEMLRSCEKLEELNLTCEAPLDRPGITTIFTLKYLTRFMIAPYYLKTVISEHPDIYETCLQKRWFWPFLTEKGYLEEKMS